MIELRTAIVLNYVEAVKCLSSLSLGIRVKVFDSQIGRQGKMTPMFELFMSFKDKLDSRDKVNKRAMQLLHSPPTLGCEKTKALLRIAIKGEVGYKVNRPNHAQ